MQTLSGAASGLKTAATQHPLTTLEQVRDAQLADWAAAVEGESAAYVVGYVTSDVVLTVGSSVLVPSVGLKRLGRLFGKLCSFSAETRVLMADGSTKPISEVEVGDWVWAQDPETGERGAREVTGVWPHEDMLVEFLVGDDRVVTTEDHPFWNATDQAWQEPQFFDYGDMVLTAAGALVPTRGLVWSSVVYDDAYDLTVTGLHTFHVIIDDQPVLVHNCWDPKSTKVFGHTFNTHGQGAKNTRSLLGRAAGTGNPQGQWLDNGAAADFLASQFDEANAAARVVPIPEGLGQVVLADGSVTAATHARLVPWSDGRQGYRSAFPIAGG